TRADGTLPSVGAASGRERGGTPRNASGVAPPPRPLARPSKQLGLVRNRGGLEQATRTAAQVVQVDPALLGLLCDPLGQVEGLVHERRACARVVTHVVQDRPLGARGDDRLVNAFDPDAGSAAVSTLALSEGLE